MSLDERITEMERELAPLEQEAQDAHERAEHVREKLRVLDERAGRTARPRMERIPTVDADFSLSDTRHTIVIAAPTRAAETIIQNTSDHTVYVTDRLETNPNRTIPPGQTMMTTSKDPLTIWTDGRPIEIETVEDDGLVRSVTIRNSRRIFDAPEITGVAMGDPRLYLNMSFGSGSDVPGDESDDEEFNYDDEWEGYEDDAYEDDDA